VSLAPQRRDELTSAGSSPPTAEVPGGAMRRILGWSGTRGLDRNDLGAFLAPARLGLPRGLRRGVAARPRQPAHLRGPGR
jgi:hypothetical protein